MRKNLFRSGGRGVVGERQRKQIAAEREGKASDDRMLLVEEFVHPWWFVGQIQRLARLAK